MSNPDGNNNASNARSRSNSNNNASPPASDNSTNPASGDEQTNTFRTAIMKNLPPVSTFYALIQVCLYLFSGRLVTSEEDVNVSWSKVVKERQVWRLFVAHLFHFSRLSVLANAITLIAMGRYMEKKFNRTAMFILVELMGALSNIFYLLISTFLCGNPSEMTTHGFAHMTYGLKVVLACMQEGLTMVDPTLIFGVYPVNLSVTWAPWEPILEILLLKLIVYEFPISGPLDTQFALRMVQALSKDVCRPGENQTLVLGFIPLPIPNEWAPLEPAFQVIVFDLIGRNCGTLSGHMSGIIAGLSFGIVTKLYPNSLAIYTEECRMDTLILTQNNAPNPQLQDTELLPLLNSSNSNNVLRHRLSFGRDNWWIGNEDEAEAGDIVLFASASRSSNVFKPSALDFLEELDHISSEDPSSDSSLKTIPTSNSIVPFSSVFKLGHADVN